MPERESWHLSKGVPITLIIALLIQTSAIVWWAASMESNVEVNTRSIVSNGEGIEKLEVRVDLMRDESAKRAVQLGRIEANQRAIKATIEANQRATQATLDKMDRTLERITP